jgi:hypothetical protein
MKPSGPTCTCHLDPTRICDYHRATGLDWIPRIREERGWHPAEGTRPPMTRYHVRLTSRHGELNGEIDDPYVVAELGRAAQRVGWSLTSRQCPFDDEPDPVTPAA